MFETENEVTSNREQASINRALRERTKGQNFHQDLYQTLKMKRGEVLRSSGFSCGGVSILRGTKRQVSHT